MCGKKKPVGINFSRVIFSFSKTNRSLHSELNLFTSFPLLQAHLAPFRDRSLFWSVHLNQLSSSCHHDDDFARQVTVSRFFYPPPHPSPVLMPLAIICISFQLSNCICYGYRYPTSTHDTLPNSPRVSILGWSILLRPEPRGSSITQRLVTPCFVWTRAPLTSGSMDNMTQISSRVLPLNTSPSLTPHHTLLTPTHTSKQTNKNKFFFKSREGFQFIRC